MRLPRFIGFLQTSQFKNVDSTGEGIRQNTYFFYPNSSLNPKTLIPSSEQAIVLTTNFSLVHDVGALNPFSEQEVVLTRNFSSFHDVGAVNPSSEQEIVLTRNFSSTEDKPDQEKANARVERYDNSSKEVPTHSSLVTANASFTASTNPPLSVDVNGSDTALSKQNIGSGDGKAREDFAVEIAHTHKGNEGGAGCNLFDGKCVRINYNGASHLII